MNRRIPLLLPLCGLIVGIVAARAEITARFLIIASASALILCSAGWIYNEIRLPRRRIFSISAFLLLLAFGFFSARNPEPPYPLAPELQGTITDVYSTPKGRMIITEVNTLIRPLSVDKCPSQEVIIFIQTDKYLYPGEIVRFPNTLHHIDEPENVLNEGYSASLRNKGIFYRGFVKDADVKVVGKEFSFRGYGMRIRDVIASRISHSKLSPECAGFVQAILTGQRRALDVDDRITFTNAGLAHILAVSGLHIGLLAVIILWLLLPLNAIKSRRLRYPLTALLLWGFAFMTGLGTPVVRAAIMTTFLCLGHYWERKNSSLNALCGAALVILAFAPEELFSAGFQLSFTCVAAIILFSNRLNFVDRLHHHHLYSFVNTVIISCVTMVAIWPLTIWYFHSFPVAFLPANLLILPLLPFYMGASILYVLMLFCGLDWGIIADGLSYSYAFFIKIAQVVSNHGELALSAEVPFYIPLLWTLALALLGIWIIKGSRLWGSIGLVSCALAIILLFIPSESTAANGFIIRSGYEQILISKYNDGNLQMIRFPKGKTSSVEVGGTKISAIDNKLYSEIPTCDVLIIGGGFKGDIMKAARKSGAKKIVLHQSIWIRDAVIMSDEVGDSVHIIALDGPYHHFSDSKNTHSSSP